MFLYTSLSISRFQFCMLDFLMSYKSSILFIFFSVFFYLFFKYFIFIYFFSSPKSLMLCFSILFLLLNPSNEFFISTFVFFSSKVSNLYFFVISICMLEFLFTHHEYIVPYIIELVTMDTLKFLSVPAPNNLDTGLCWSSFSFRMSYSLFGFSCVQ